MSMRSSLRRSSACFAASSDDALATRRIVPFSSSRSTMQPSPSNGTVRSARRCRVSSRSRLRSSSALASARNSSSWLRSVSSLCSRALSIDSAARRDHRGGEVEVLLGVQALGLGRHERHHAQRLAPRAQRHEHRGAQPEPADHGEVLRVARALLDHLVADVAVQLRLAGAQHLGHSLRRCRVRRVAILEVPGEALPLGVACAPPQAARACRRRRACGSRTSPRAAAP